MRSRILPPAVAAVLLATAGGCALTGGAAEPSPAVGPTVTVATSADPEAQLLAGIVAGLLDAADIPTEMEQLADAGAARQALELGAVDVRVGYTGEAWLEVMGRPDPPGDPLTSFSEVRDFDARQGLIWMRPAFADEPGPTTPPANATFAFVVDADGTGAELRTMSQLASQLTQEPDAIVCVDRDFGTRPDGLRAVLDAYRVRTDRDFVAATPEEAVAGVAAGDCLAGLTTATDGRAWAAGLRPLVDDLEVLPAFVPSPVVREPIRDAHPGILAALAPLPTHLTTAMLGTWNARVVAGDPLPAVVEGAVRELLILDGRLTPSPSPPATEG